LAGSKSGFAAYFHGCLTGRALISRTRKAEIGGCRRNVSSIDARAYQSSRLARAGRARSIVSIAADGSKCE
jgi:hypothetical protein